MIKLVAVGLTAALALALAFAQDDADERGVLARLTGPYSVIASGVNAVGTIFVELDRPPLNIMQALLDGIRHEDAPAYVIVTPRSLGNVGDTTGHVYFVVADEEYARNTNWQGFRSARGFTTDPRLRMSDLVMEGGTKGRYLGFALPAATAPAGTTTPSARRDGCDFYSDARGSTMTCWSRGRMTFRQVCVVNPATFAITCNSYLTD